MIKVLTIIKQLISLVTLPSLTRGIGEQLSSQLSFICHLELAIRGDNEELGRNLRQLLCMKAMQNSNLADRLKQKEKIYSSPDIKKEFFSINKPQTYLKENESPYLFAEQLTSCKSIRNLLDFTLLIPLMQQFNFCPQKYVCVTQLKSVKIVMSMLYMMEPVPWVEKETELLKELFVFGLSRGNHHDVKLFYKQQYNEVLHLIVICIKDQFSWPGYKNTIHWKYSWRKCANRMIKQLILMSVTFTKIIFTKNRLYT